MSGQTWSLLSGALAGGAAGLIPASRSDRLRAAGRIVGGVAGGTGRRPVRAALPARAMPARWDHPWWGRGRSGAAAPTPGELALLADQLAALVRAGLPPNRVWPILSERAAAGSTRAMAAAVAEGQLRGQGTAEAVRRVAGVSEVAGQPGPRRSAGSDRSGEFMTGASGWWRRRRSPEPAAARLAVAIDVSERTGAALAETLQRFADGLRADLHAEQERESAMAGPRTTATILSALPLAGLGLGGLIGSHPWHTLLLTGPGRVCLLAGGVAWLTGRAWSAALIRRATPQS